MKRLMFFALLLLGITAQAQKPRVGESEDSGMTARKFTLNLTDDGKAQMVCFLPETSSGRAIVGVPGGGYSVLSNGHEGYLASDWLNKQGIAYFVVNYRLPNGDRSLPIGDVQKGIRIVRDSATVWGINPHDVGIMGFSAGGHLSSVISTLSDFDVRPDFTILFYPVISMDERVSHKWSCINFLGEEGHNNPELVRQFSTQNAVKRHLTPPALIVTANDDRLVPFVTNGLEYYKAMRNAGNECTMHVYPTGDHGFGFGPWFKYHDLLLEDIGSWLKNLQAPKPDAIRVACIGNSITDGHGIEMATQYGYPALLQKALGSDYWVKNFGVSGRTMLNKGDVPYMNEMAWRDAVAFNPDIVVIKLGTNDSKPQNWVHISEFKKDLEQMIKALDKKRIILCTPIPAFKSSWNINDSIIVNDIIPVQKEVARKHGLKLIDLHTMMANDEELVQPDGIHPNEKGAAKIAEIIAGAIK
jgi:acetyl esterase/lipase